jgi:hypothetical protein
MTSTSHSPLVTAAEAARILGVTRGRVVALAGSAVGFPAAEATATGGRRWPRAAVEAWAAAHPDRGPRHPGLQVPPVGERSRQVWKVVDLAAEEAKELHHDWVSGDHLVLALLHPDWPGRCWDRSVSPRRRCGRRLWLAWATPTSRTTGGLAVICRPAAAGAWWSGVSRERPRL